MTKKDYELIANGFYRARIINEKRNAKLFDGINIAMMFVVDQLEANNPRFDRNKFLTACGIDNRVVATDPTDGKVKSVSVIIED